MLSPYVPGATVDVGQAFRRHSVYGGREEVDCAAVYQDFVCGRRRGKRGNR